eukprot:Blabericola_migrator_1__4204@NODE_228_length_11100_cov_168_633645_g194_i0_p1_GENE_NODE_228_length_11100_cov_168_633645_g194_i0NODE_228_length_11100_cov_168_633645_g194_i0_p1_ORF_typecomplete_len937_score133_28RCC1/PF00415_18/6_8e08RCC1/PF00415_18/7_6e10RCC1/PF00415_18/0_0017RCC1_2/PF13540_6/8_2RCC1_2/PF13540_6/4_1e05RCC1_2/PF13540_6/6_9e06RCC1_2/PF13540_6/3e02RCC1_2/PF13540_6/5_2e03RCC1_2/PF13540_6/1_2e04VID27/PF08553_10/5_7e03VID27/PF08553_10/0_054_NODE_228_length_11100_cov_168_633645_g194_i079
MDDISYSDYDPKDTNTKPRKFKVWARNDEEGFIGDRKLLDVQSICHGWKHAGLITDRGELYIWGSDGQCGRLGMAHHQMGRVEGSPVPVPGLSEKKVLKLCCGKYHTLALVADCDNGSDDGEHEEDGAVVYSWGDNFAGQLGHGYLATKSFNATPTPVKLATRRMKIRDIAVGYNHSMLITVDNRIFMWGDNSVGQCGLPCKAFEAVDAPKELVFHGDRDIKFTKICAAANVSVAYNGSLCFIWGVGVDARLKIDEKMEDKFSRPSLCRRPGSGSIKSCCLTADGRWLAVCCETAILLGCTTQRPLKLQEIPLLPDMVDVVCTTNYVYALHYTGVVFACGPLSDKGSSIAVPKELSSQPPHNSQFAVWPISDIVDATRIAAGRNTLYVGIAGSVPHIPDFFASYAESRQIRYPFLDAEIEEWSAEFLVDSEEPEEAVDSEYADRLVGDIMAAIAASKREHRQRVIQQRLKELALFPPPELKFLIQVRLAKSLDINNVIDTLQFATAVNAEALQLYCVVFVLMNLGRCLLRFQSGPSPLMSIKSDGRLAPSLGLLVSTIRAIVSPKQPVAWESPWWWLLHTCGRQSFCRDQVTQATSLQGLDLCMSQIAMEINSSFGDAKIYGTYLSAAEKILGHGIMETERATNRVEGSDGSTQLETEKEATKEAETGLGENASRASPSKQTKEDQQCDTRPLPPKQTPEDPPSDEEAPTEEASKCQSLVAECSTTIDSPTLADSSPTFSVWGRKKREAGSPSAPARQNVSRPRELLQEEQWIAVGPSRKNTKSRAKQTASPPSAPPQTFPPKQQHVSLFDHAWRTPPKPSQPHTIIPTSPPIPRVVAPTQTVSMAEHKTGWRVTPDVQRSLLLDTATPLQQTQEEQEFAMVLEAIAAQEAEDEALQRALELSLIEQQSPKRGRGRGRSGHRGGSRGRRGRGVRGS